MKRLHQTTGKLLLIGGFLLALCACSKDNDNPQPHVAGLMVFNLSPDQPLIGIALSGNTLNIPLPYTSYSGGYIRIYPGQRSTESFDVSSGNTITSATFTYEPDKYYSLFVAGAGGTYKNIVTDDGLDSLSGRTGESYIRYVNAIPDSARPEVTVSDGQQAVISDEPRFTDVSAFTPVKEGAVDITISDGGKIDASRTINLSEGKVYTVLFLGNPSGNDPADSIQIRYVENGTLEVDTAEAKVKTTD